MTLRNKKDVAVFLGELRLILKFHNKTLLCLLSRRSMTQFRDRVEGEWDFNSANKEHKGYYYYQQKKGALK